jgi:hypothetical protein
MSKGKLLSLLSCSGLQSLLFPVSDPTLAEVVGSNPTQSIFINQGNCSIKLSLLLGDCTTKPASNALDKFDIKKFLMMR